MLSNFRIQNLALLACLLFPFLAFSQTIVVNGDFEAGDLTGWNGTGAYVLGQGEGYPVIGNFAVNFGSVGSLDFIDQTLVTTPSASYDLTFQLSSDGALPNAFQVIWDGTVIFDRTNIPVTLDGLGNQNFETLTFNGLIASSSATLLQFGGQNDPNETTLDSVVVTPSAVPEPSTYAAVLGLASLGVAMIRRRGRTAVAV